MGTTPDNNLPLNSGLLLLIRPPGKPSSSIPGTESSPRSILQTHNLRCSLTSPPVIQFPLWVTRSRSCTTGRQQLHLVALEPS